MKMNLLVILLLVIIGMIVGGLSGMLGIGGGIFMIPAMVLLLGFTQHQAVGTSLAVMLPPIGFFAAYNYYKAGHVNLTYALILAVAFMLGSYLTSKIALDIPEQGLKKFFAVVLILVGIKMLFTK
jgi:uncharacterized protein